MDSSSRTLLGLAIPLVVVPFAATSCTDDPAGTGGAGATSSISAGTTTSSTMTSGATTTSAATTTSGSTASASGTGGTGGGTSGCVDPLASPPCFAGPVSLDAGGAVSALAIGTWDAAGGDVVIGRGAEILYFAGDGAGALATSPTAIGATGITTKVHDLALGKIDSGSPLDVVVASDAVHAHVVFGNGMGGVAAESNTVNGEGNPFDVAVADLNGSGATADIVEAQGAGGCSVITTTSGTEGAGFVASSVQICKAETVAIGRCSGAFSCVFWTDPASLSTLHAGEIHAVTPISIGASTTTALEGAGGRLVSSKFDADTIDDAAILVAGNKVNVLFGDSEAGWLSQGAVFYASYPVGAGAADIATGDLDGDGDADLVVANAGADSVSILTNGGAGTFTVSTLALAAGAAPTRVAVGDLNGDGTDDIALATTAPTALTILLSKKP
jgi:hypothetical protein